MTYVNDVSDASVSKVWRTLIGLPVAAAVAAIGMILPAVFEGDSLVRGNFFGWFLFAYILVLPIALIVGVPLVWLVNRWAKVNVFTSVACGSLVAWATVPLISSSQPLRVHLIYAAIGAVSGLVFWCIWAWPRKT